MPLPATPATHRYPEAYTGRPSLSVAYTGQPVAVSVICIWRPVAVPVTFTWPGNMLHRYPEAHSSGQVTSFSVHLAGPYALQLSRMPFARPGECHGVTIMTECRVNVTTYPSPRHRPVHRLSQSALEKSCIWLSASLPDERVVPYPALSDLHCQTALLKVVFSGS